MSEERNAEFLALSAKVSDKMATDDERARWRELRAELAMGKPAAPPGKIQRAHERSSRKLRVHYTVVPEMTLTFTDEVGGGGLRLRTQKQLEEGTMLVLRIDVANEPAAPLTVDARVVWSKREGGHFSVGVEFVDLPAPVAERLEALVHKKTE